MPTPAAAYAATTIDDAASIPGSTVGAAVALGAEATVDLTEYAGRWVHIYSMDAAAIMSFQPLADATILVTGVAPVSTYAVPDAIDAGATGIMRIVPRSAPQLRHAAVEGSGVLRIIPA